MDKTPLLLRRSFLLLLCLIVNLTVAQTNNITIDQSALLALKTHITSDPKNIVSKNWSTTSSVCDWIGVTCGLRHIRVTALNLSYMNLVGTIPSHIGNLSFLSELSLRNNSFHGTLPTELARLRRLKFVSLSFNKLRGEVPPWLGYLTRLQVLSLHGNQFSGSIPAAIFNSSSLQLVDLSNNQLSGSIAKEIGNSTMLKELYLDFNHLQEIPGEIGHSQLEVLRVQYNALGLGGPIPMNLFNMSSLKVMALTENRLYGSLPDNLCQNLPLIQGFYLSKNRLGGQIPSDLTQCKQLGVLGLSYNHFIGTIPKSIGNLTLVQQIFLGWNNLTGTIPTEIGNLHNVQILSLIVNKLKGSIPSSIFNMSTVRLISLSSNQLSGSLPSNIGPGVPNLEELYLWQNDLSGIIPKSISNASKLTMFELNWNSLSGFIPTSLSLLTNLRYLSLEFNNLSLETSSDGVSIFSSLPNFKDLIGFSLSYNPLNVPLLIPFGNLSLSFQRLGLSNCKLRGSIPNDIGNSSNLFAIEIALNELSGSIPTSIGRLQNLQGLELGWNRLEGPIPNELCQIKKLNSLFLSNNKLSLIPMCLGNITSLRNLSLGSNEINSIPSTIWSLRDILHLNLSSNLLNEPLPTDIDKLKVVINMDLSYNQLSGNIPSSIGGLQGLVYLSFANNKLEGSIPHSLGNLPSLEFLDLSNNSLSGELPKSLEEILNLKHLNVSVNKLKGEIPTGGSFGNLSAQSFMSNEALCGSPKYQVPPCPNSPLKPSPKSSASKLRYILPGTLSAILLLVVFAVMLILYSKRSSQPPKETSLLLGASWRRVSYQELSRATNGFGKDNIIGAGSFGSVYKATLSDGLNVAVKVFDMKLEEAFKSFDAECEVLCNIRHRNLIKIISVCSTSDFKALVLDYMPRGSFEQLLYSSEIFLNVLQRLEIMIDVASALEYLHYGFSVPIVHCDLKPNNILLDEDLVAHVVDFGIARLLGGQGSMTRTMTLATIGYMAPEFGSEGIVSRRVDAFSFGIILLETFTRKKPTDEMFAGDLSLKQWVANSTPHAITQVIDASLLELDEEDHNEDKMDCLLSILDLALTCSASLPEDRITMKDVVSRLTKIKIKLLKSI